MMTVMHVVSVMSLMSLMPTVALILHSVRYFCHVCDGRMSNIVDFHDVLGDWCP
jgi:type IV secretory pathway VirB3-like protein